MKANSVEESAVTSPMVFSEHPTAVTSPVCESEVVVGSSMTVDTESLFCRSGGLPVNNLAGSKTVPECAAGPTPAEGEGPAGLMSKSSDPVADTFHATSLPGSGVTMTLSGNDTTWTGSALLSFSGTVTDPPATDQAPVLCLGLPVSTPLRPAFSMSAAP